MATMLVPMSYCCLMYGIRDPKLPSFIPATKNEKPELRSLRRRRGIGGSSVVTSRFSIMGFAVDF